MPFLIILDWDDRLLPAARVGLSSAADHCGWGSGTFAPVPVRGLGATVVAMAAERATPWARTHAELVEIECTLDHASRSPDVVDHFARLRDPWRRAVSIDTSVPRGDVLALAVTAVADARPPAL